MRPQWSERNSPSTADDVTVALLVQRLREGRPVEVRLWGRSMLPWLWPGVRVRVAPGLDLRIGDIVLIDRGGSVLAHRLVSRAGGKWVVRGDYYGESMEVGGAILGRLVALWAGVWLPLPRAITLAQSRLTPWTSRGAPVWRLAQRASYLGGRLSGRARRVDVVLFGPEHRGMLARYFYDRNRRPSAEALASWERLVGPRGFLSEARRSEPSSGLGGAPNSGGFAVLALRGSRIVGHASLLEQPDGTALSVDWWIAASLRGLGVGRRVVTRMLEEADRRGVPRTLMHARPHSPSHALARSVGFVRSARHDEHPGLDALVRERPRE